MQRSRASRPRRTSAKPAVFFNMPEMLVNLNTAGKRTSFLKISVSLELENAGPTCRGSRR